MALNRGYGVFLLRRLGFAALTLLGLATIAFVMTKMIPGDEAQIAAGPDAAPEQVAAVRLRLGLDAPLVVQYLRFLYRVLQGDFGTSITTYQPVVADIAQVLPGTLELVLLAMILNLIIAIPSATFAAVQRDRLPDLIGRVVAVVAGGLPIFWLALMLQFFIASKLKLLPISGQYSFDFSAEMRTGMPVFDALIGADFASLRDALAHVVLPAGVLALHFSTQIFRALRASLLGVLEGDFIVPVRAKGASTARILLRHALPNSMAPVLTLAGTQVAEMLGSAVLVEVVFARQGVGAYLANAVLQKDTFAVVGTVLFVGILVCAVNLLVDILHLTLDPRIRATALGGVRA